MIRVAAAPLKISMLPYIFLFIQLAFAVFFFFLCLAFVTGAPFVLTTNSTAQSMIRLAHIKKGMIAYDLGSGTGKLLFLAAEKGAKAVGFEINPFLVLLSNLRAIFSPYKHSVKTVWKNLWTADLRYADVIFLYLIPWKMERLEKKLKTEVKKGSIVVSNSFIFPNFPCIRKDKKNHVFVYKI